MYGFAPPMVGQQNKYQGTCVKKDETGKYNECVHRPPRGNEQTHCPKKIVNIIHMSERKSD